MGYQNKTNKELIQEISKLNQQITKLKKSEDKNKQKLEVQQVLYNISRAANSSISLNQLYKIIHKELGTIIDTTNFFIALADYQKDEVCFPYFVDEKDDNTPIVNFSKSKSLASHVIKNGRSLLIDYKGRDNLISQGKLIVLGYTTNKLNWLGVPLKIKDKVIGAMVVQSYINPDLYHEEDIKLMEFVSEQVATAINRKRIEEAFQASQQEFANLFRNNPEALVYVDEKSNILDINSQFAKLFGYTLEEVKGRNINEGFIHPPNKIKEGKDQDKTVLSKGYVNYETIRKKKDGTCFPVSISGSDIVVDDKVKGIILTYIDITERKKMEEKLRQSEEKFSEIFKNIPDAAFYQGTERTILDVNPALTRLFGYTKEEMLGRNIDEIGLYPKGRIKEGKKLTRKTLNEDLTNFETIRQKKDGTLVPVRLSTSFVKIKDKVAGIIALYQDITERKQNETMQSVLYNISKAANSPISLNQFYRTIHKELSTVIDTTNFFIALTDYQKNEIYFPYFVDEKDILESAVINFSETNSLIVYVIKTNQPLLVNYKKLQKMIAQRKINVIGSLTDKSIWLGVPLKVEDKVIGAMAIQSYTDSKLYSEKDIKIMEFVSSQVATAIERKKMEEELKNLAYHDPLTGIYSRAYGLEFIQRQIKLTKRNKNTFLLAYTDLNNLKGINDKFGHEEGDKAIIKIVNLFQSTLRETDIIIRMGGDEFLLVFPDSFVKGIPVIKKRLYDKLARQNVVSNKPYKIGFSIGFSCYDPLHPKSIEELILIADQEMYKNKKDSRLMI